MKKNLLIYFLLLISCNTLYGQAVGDFKLYTPGGNVKQTVVMKDKVFLLCEGYLFVYHTGDESIESLNIQNGLSDNGIKIINGDPLNNRLMICYSNNNIDLIDSKGIHNIPDIKNKISNVSKEINSVFLQKDKAYLSTGMGVVVVNLNKYEIEDTYTLKENGVIIPIQSVTIDGDSLYSGTHKGLFAGHLKKNLLDYQNWYKRANDSIDNIAFFNGQIYTLKKGKGLYRYDKTGYYSILEDKGITSLFFTQEHLIAFSIVNIHLWNKETYKVITPYPQYECYDVDLTADGKTMWIGTGENGLIRWEKNKEGNYENTGEIIYPAGPASSMAFRIFSNQNGLTYITSGGRSGDRFTFLYKNFGTDFIMIKDDQDQWRNISGKNTTSYTNVPFWDPCAIIADPKDPSHFFVSSWGEGLYEFKNYDYHQLYTPMNSPLESIFPNDWRYTRIDALSYDKEGNLWMSNSPANYTNIINQIKILKKDGSWLPLSFDELNRKQLIQQIIFDKNGKAWISVADGLVFVWDYNKTLDNKSDDKKRSFIRFSDQDGKPVETTFYGEMVEDKNGYIWIGTEVGPIVIQNSSRVFESNFYCTRIKVPRKELEDDGTQLADYLLGSEQINTIAIDGANRKWFGTENNGVYLVSENGMETLLHFTVENSPLPSNKIFDIEIEEKTGIVYIGTEKGLITYRSDATEGAPKLENDNIYAFPNPVRPEYEGVITVTGLMEKTFVKIVTLKGEVITQGYSNGGQFTWNGRNSFGERAASGIYLVLCSTSDGQNAGSTRIMFIE